MMSDSEFNDLILSVEKSTDDFIRNMFADGLVNNGDQIYIRVVGGRLQWIRGNKIGDGEQWDELTPNIASVLESGGTLPAVPALREDSTTAIQEPEAYEIGWYQDVKGDLYQFDGKTWVGKEPNKIEIQALEFLG